MLQCLAQGPNLLRRARHALHTGDDTFVIRGEIMSNYRTCKAILAEMNARSVEDDLAHLNASQTNARTRDFIKNVLVAHYDRTYGIGLTVALFFHCMLSGLNAHDETTLFDADDYAQEALDLAERAVVYRPLGAGYMIFSLQAAWIATPDPELRNRLLNALVDFQNDYQIWSKKQLVHALEWTADYLCLGNVSQGILT